MVLIVIGTLTAQAPGGEPREILIRGETFKERMAEPVAKRRLTSRMRKAIFWSNQQAGRRAIIALVSHQFAPTVSTLCGTISRESAPT